MDHFKTTEDWLEDCLDTTTVRGREKADVLVVRGKGKKEHKENNRKASKPHSTPLTLKWLEETYEIAEGVCIPRSTLYLHYMDFCDKNDTQPVNAASFGKIIRQQFPQITTRRLGTRGQSKYHYYGIGVKETSPYYDVMYSRKGVQSSPDGKKDAVKQMVTYSPRSKLGTLLPEFPNVKDLQLPPNVTEDKVSTFLMMYRTHCQRILDTVIRANFDEVQSFLLHFWQGMPQHIVPILGTQCVVQLVGVCDSVLYKAISGVLMPTVLQPLPDSLTQVIRKFAKHLDDWLKQALSELPEPLRKMKFDLARRFAQLLRRQTSLNHLCQASRTVIHSADITSQMLDDWSNVDLSSITKQTLYTMDKYCEKDYETIVSLYKEFEQLIEEQSPIEAYLEWLDNMVNRCVIQPSSKKTGSLRRIARQFLLMWSCFGTRVIRDMTLHSAPSFGSFHLLHLMFDDYVLYLVENLHSNERAAELLRCIKGEEDGEMQEDLILPNPSVMTSYPLPGETPAVGGGVIIPERDTVITDTREAYLSSNSTYASSPQSAISGHTSSPAPSAASVQYDNMSEHHVTQLSPVTIRTNVNAPADNLSNPGDPGYQYGRYMSSMTSNNASHDPNNYNYCGFSNSQYYYGSGTGGSREVRDTGVQGGVCGSWGTDRYSSNLTPLHSTHFTSQHSATYGQYAQRGSEFDGSYYDSSMFTQNRSHTQNGVIYQHYSDPSAYYGQVSNEDIRKRKHADDDRNLNHKRMNSDYSYIVPPGGYARA